MSIQFNDTSTYKGLVQLYEREIGLNRGDISGDTDKLKDFAARVNVTLDDFFAIALPASGVWQFDDSNQTDYPIIKTNIVSGQRDYSFVLDANSNLILDIFKVMILPSATATLYQELGKTDAQSESSGIDTENTSTGTPYQYDKTANGIFFDPIPGYNASNGLKIYINREGSYFTYTDTTRKPGVPGLFHKYFYLKPARDYARINTLANYATLDAEVLKLEGDPERGIIGSIERYFGARDRDDTHQLMGAPVQYL